MGPCWPDRREGRMPTTEERLASLEARMDRINDLFTLIESVRSDIKELRSDISGLRSDMHAQLAAVRTEAQRDFRWVVGIQLATMGTVIGALVSVIARQ